MHSDNSRPYLIDGGRHIDERGTMAFVNEFDFEDVDRFYYLRASTPFQPRGWVGHKIDKKYFTVIQGKALVSVVRPDDWDNASPNLPVERFTLSAENPQILCIPPGHATGSMMLTPDAILMIFSSGKIEDASRDDYRFPKDSWPILPVEQSERE